MATQEAGIVTRVTRRRGGRLREEMIWGWLLQTPVLIGLVVFVAGPLIASFVLAFTDWQMLTPASFVGLDNFNTLVNDPLFLQALGNTAFVTLISVPLYMVLSLLLALALDQKLRGMSIYRVIFFLPSQVPAVANAILWLWMFNPDYGLVNWFLGLFHLPESSWLQDPSMAKPALIVMGMWTIGTTMIIYLAGLQGVPVELHEAAAIDGASTWRRFWNVTLPLLTPVIFFTLIMGIINTMQSGFTTTYIFTAVNGPTATETVNGGPGNALLLFILYIYDEAFVRFQMGYASLLAWVLFVIILAVTLINFKLAGRWVYYEGQTGG
jgi:multiple sugar transport system permease protein